MAEPSSRRRALAKERVPAKGGPEGHAGLWLDRYLSSQAKGAGSEGDSRGATARAALMEEVAKIPVPADYPRAFERWCSALAALEQALPGGAVVQEQVEISGRVVVGIGGASVSEAGLTLHRVWGTPFLPGSALKGLAAATARHLLEDGAWARPADEDLKREDVRRASAWLALFGDTRAAGHGVFFDAWWVPESAAAPLVQDVVTVHHPDYYQKGGAPPADWDSPKPIPFLAARGSFLLAVGGPEPWASAAMDILRVGLQELGIGAKTASGYGLTALTRGATPPSHPTP